MPFTPAHIGFILPVHQRWSYFSLSALIIGSIVPDLDFLFRLTNIRFHLFAFSLNNIFLFMLPLSWIVYFYYHFVAKAFLIFISPFEVIKPTSNFISVKDAISTRFIPLNLSFLLAIFTHLWLDIVGHSLDAHACFLFIKSFSDNSFLWNLFYFIGMYGLPILLTFIGFYLIYRFKKYYVISNNNIFALIKRQVVFYILWILMAMVIFCVKWRYTDIEQNFIIDYIAIISVFSFLVSFIMVSGGYKIYVNYVQRIEAGK